MNQPIMRAIGFQNPNPKEGGGGGGSSAFKSSILGKMPDFESSTDERIVVSRN